MRSFLAVLAAAVALLLGGAPSDAAPLTHDVIAKAAGSTDISAQRRVRRAVPQIRVSPPYYYRRFHSAYPLPYDFEYPGPNAARQCNTRYVTEYRPSGPVIVPRMRCWWVRG